MEFSKPSIGRIGKRIFRDRNVEYLPIFMAHRLDRRLNVNGTFSYVTLTSYY